MNEPAQPAASAVCGGQMLRGAQVRGELVEPHPLLEVLLQPTLEYGPPTRPGKQSEARSVPHSDSALRGALRLRPPAARR
jgi:hypothetical protein